MRRTTIGLLALMFVTTTGVAGAVLHVCGMESLVRRTCCCDDSHDRTPVQLKPIDECCGAAIAKAELPRVATGSEKGCVDAPMPAVSAVSTDDLSGQQLEESQRIPLARGSPPLHGPPLFVSNCSYLI